MKVALDNPQAVAAVAAKVLKTHPHMVVATVGANGPWAVPVHQATSQDLRLTWRSKTAARHSQNLASNPQASVVIYSVDYFGEISLFLEGTAGAVEDKAGLEPLAKLWPDAPPEAFLGQAEARIYAFQPTAAWLNDDQHVKTPIDMNLLQEAIAKENN